MEKIYNIEATLYSNARLFVKANSEEEARKIAQQLLDNGSGDVQLTQTDLGSVTINEVWEMNPGHLDNADLKNAESNAIEYRDLTEANTN